MKKQNVIIFFTDQQRWDTTGIHGNPCNLTPNFDQMAMEGTFPEYSFTPQPVCGPARGILQTGKYATTIGLYKNGIPLSCKDKTLANYFNEEGYHTGYIGKWHLGSTRHAVPKDERGGYQYWLGANSLEATSQAYHTLVYNNDDKPVVLPGYRVDALADAAVRYIDDNKEQPFFLFLSFLEPHFQNSNDSYPAPDILKKKAYSYMPPDLCALGGNSWQHISGYYGMVNRLDDALGRIRDCLKSLNLANDTIVVFTSDHACHFKTRNNEYKRSCHDSSIRIPMAITGGPFTAGGRLKEMVSLIDLAPTLLEACNIPIPDDMQGGSFLPVVNRTSTTWDDNIFVQISESQVGRAIRTRRWKYAVEALDKDPVRDPGSLVYTETALYDLEHDPFELDNLIGYTSHRRVADVMTERLKKKMKEIGEETPEIIMAEEKYANQRVVFPGEEYF